MKNLFLFLFFIYINCKSKLIDQIPDCEISEKGRFKYIQIKITQKKEPKDSKIVIRGKYGLAYHKNNFKLFLSTLKKSNKKLFKSFTYEPIGGGFIKINKTNIIIDGFSNAYGYADHSITAKILKKEYPNHKIDFDKTFPDDL